MAGAIMAMLAPKKPGMDNDEDDAPPSSKSGGSSAKKLALMAVQAIKAGDDDAAADALVGAMKACSNESDEPNYGS